MRRRKPYAFPAVVGLKGSRVAALKPPPVRWEELAWADDIVSRAFAEGILEETFQLEGLEVEPYFRPAGRRYYGLRTSLSHEVLTGPQADFDRLADYLGRKLVRAMERTRERLLEELER